ncbi:endonuclease [Salmonella phage NR01]|uniref:Treble clef zinc finger domain-containing protein n=1 Tax=Salmonella phage NR01 TaxID=1647411 RepID=A0A161C354_9CAUD|nr:endonuclease [Salmonella phage NR01]AKN44384.1 hypothetical protein NR01_0045 [Salmonella phage NR01]
MKKLTVKQINKELEPRGFSIVSEWINIRTPAIFRCSKGHRWNAHLNNIRKGSGCPHCSGKAKLTIEQINQQLANRGIKLIPPYINAHSQAVFECAEGHRWTSSVDKVKNAGRSCPICVTTSYLYIFYSPRLGTKIGTSKSPDRRLLEIKKDSNLEDLSIYGVYSCDESAYNLENKAHRYFCSRQLFRESIFDGSTEFFNIRPEEAEEYLLSQGAIKCREIM